MDKGCLSCNLKNFHSCGLKRDPGLATNCPCTICLVKVMCSQKCSTRYEYFNKNIELIPKHI